MTTLRDRLAAALAESYRIERELGGGGMSQVFLANETALGRPVVIKVVSPELSEGLSAERFAREMKLAARLQQANIVPVLSAGVADGVPYYTMPFVKGESLRARMSGGAPIGLTESIGILRDVARALAYAHSEDIVHRDIKPDNVLLSHGTAVVTDFGIAKALTASRTQDGVGSATLTQAGGSIGTPAYMAPEQAVGDAVDHRTDLYAFGVMAYELLSEAHPFAHHTTPQKLVGAQLTETPAALTGKKDRVPPLLAALVMRCLEKDPRQRPVSAMEVLSALDQVTTSGDRPAAASRAARPRMLVAAAALVMVAGLGVWLATRGGDSTGSTAPAEKSLAVLPFESVGGDTANAYFAEGIGEELTTALARLPGVRVAGRSSALRFKGKSASAQEVGAALGVGSVLDGTVRRAGGRVRVTAQLTSASDGLVQWSESYDREAKEVFELQDDITRAIVAALQVRLATGSTAAHSGAGTTNLEAYDLYLRGLFLLRRRGAGLLNAAELLEQAIAKDSMFARAHAALATVLLTQPYYLPVRMAETIPRARSLAQRAIKLDANLSEGHQALGIALYGTYEWEAAERELRGATTLDPNSGEAQYRLGFLLLTAGHVSRAIPELERGKVLDPLYALTASYLGYAQALAGNVDAAVAESRRAVELDSSNVATRTLMARVYLAAGRTAEAAATSRGVIEDSDDPRRLGVAAYSFSRAGDSSASRAITARVEALPVYLPARNAGLALAYLGLGDTARALGAMERAAAMAGGDLLFTIVPSDWAYDPVRESPRFAAVLRRFNLDVALLTGPRGGRPE